MLKWNSCRVFPNVVFVPLMSCLSSLVHFELPSISLLLEWNWHRLPAVISAAVWWCGEPSSYPVHMFCFQSRVLRWWWCVNTCFISAECFLLWCEWVMKCLTGECDLKYMAVPVIQSSFFFSSFLFNDHTLATTQTRAVVLLFWCFKWLVSACLCFKCSFYALYRCLVEGHHERLKQIQNSQYSSFSWNLPINSLKAKSFLIQPYQWRRIFHFNRCFHLLFLHITCQQRAKKREGKKRTLPLLNPEQN